MAKKIKRIYSLILLTFKEGIREKVFYGIVITFFFLLGMDLLLGEMSGVERAKVLRDLGLVSIELTGLLLMVFFLVNSLQRDRESKMMEIFLNRFSRSEFIIGKYLGFLMILFLLTLGSTVIFYLLLIFHQAQQPAIWLAVYFSFLKLSLISVIAMFFSLLSSSATLVNLLSLGTYVAGSTTHYALEVLSLHKASSLQTNVVRFYYHIVPQLNRFEIKLMASYGELPTTQYFISSTLYAFLYVVIIHLISIYFFRWKDL